MVYGCPFSRQKKALPLNINEGRASQAAGASGASEASLAGEECDYTGPRRSRGYCDNFFDGLTSQAGRSERSERGQPGC